LSRLEDGKTTLGTRLHFGEYPNKPPFGIFSAISRHKILSSLSNEDQNTPRLNSARCGDNLVDLLLDARVLHFCRLFHLQIFLTTSTGGRWRGRKFVRVRSKIVCLFGCDVADTPRFWMRSGVLPYHSHCTPLPASRHLTSSCSEEFPSIPRT
jgi:hypothetical protein